MKSKTILINVHGGFGNQMCQFFYAFLLDVEEKAKLVAIDRTDRYSVARKINPMFSRFIGRAGPFCSIIFAVLKVVEKFTGRSISLTFFNRTYLSGYYQSIPESFLADTPRVKAAINRIQTIIGIESRNGPAPGGRLLHLRLTDFFPNDRLKLKYLSRLSGQITGKYKVVTDEEDVVMDFILLNGLDDLWEVESTVGLDDIHLMQKISQHQEVITNGSTLALWGAIFGSSMLLTSNPNHQRYYNALKSN